MILDKNALRVIGAASTDATRYIIGGLLVEREGARARATATSGKVLLSVAWTPLPDDDFPKVEGVPQDDPTIQGVVLSREAIGKLLKAIPQKSTLPILNTAKMTLHKNGGDYPQATFATTDLETTSLFTTKGMEGNYPNFKQCIPPLEGMRRAILNVTLLSNLLKTISETGLETVKFSMSEDSNGPIRLDGKTERGLEVVAVIMPMRWEEDEKEASETQAEQTAEEKKNE